jgi:hypothetical protein
MFSDEVESRHVRLSGQEVREILGEKQVSDLPGLGVIISSSEHQKTHEWSRIESGVFTHEVLSGLSGPADVNLDGKIEYSELIAFVSAANREISDSRGKIRVIAKPPPRNHSIPIVDLTTFSRVAFLTGDPSSLGHFSIDLANGERYLDANLGDMREMHVVVPLDESAYISYRTEEAMIPMDENRTIELALLDFEGKRFSARGRIENAFQKGLFTAAYGRRYYLGFIDNSGLVGVAFDAERLALSNTVNRDDVHRRTPSWRKAAAITGSVLTGSAAVAAIAFGVLSLKARSDFNETEMQRQSDEAANRYQSYTTAFWVTAGIVPVAALLTWFVWPKTGRREASRPRFSAEPGSGTLTLSLRFL